MTRSKKRRPGAAPPRPPDSARPGPATSAGPRSAGPRRLVVALLFFLLSIPLYANTIANRYALDDAIVITQNAYTKKGIAGLADIFTHDSFAGFPMVRKDLVSGGRYRPLSIATFAVEHQAFGLNPGISHLVNMLLFGITGALLYLLLARLFRGEPRTRWWMSPAFLITLLYVAHPLHTEIVANIKGRDEILALLFSLGAFYACLAYYDGPAARGGLSLVAGGACLFLGALSKESALPFVAIIPLGLWFFRRADRRRLTAVLGALLIPAALYGAARLGFAGPMKNVHTVELLNDPFAFASLSQRLATVSKTLGIYLRLFLVPQPLTHDYYYNQVPLTDFANPAAFVPLLIAIGLAVAAVAGARRRSPIAFGLLFFALEFSIVSNVFFSIGTTMAERFLYIPSLGLSISLVFALCSLSDRFLGRSGRRSIAVLLILVAAAYSVKTIARNRDWKDNLTLFTADLHASSNSAKEQGDLASALAGRAGEEKDPAIRPSPTTGGRSRSTRITASPGSGWGTRSSPREARSSPRRSSVTGRWCPSSRPRRSRTGTWPWRRTGRATRPPPWRTSGGTGPLTPTTPGEWSWRRRTSRERGDPTRRSRSATP
jgi:hypothetical protein